MRNRRFSAADLGFLSIFAAAAVLLVAGLVTPAFTNDSLARSAQTFSILTGAFNLGAGGSPGLAFVIILFSAVFPAVKLVAMLMLWTFRFAAATESRGVQALEVLGKWSMLDVFVLATTIGAAHLELLNRTTTEAGIYIFGFAILLSMVASVLLRFRLRTRVELTMPVVPRGQRLVGLVVGASSLLLFFSGILMPLFSIEKWVFWNKEYSLLTALPRMLGEGEILLPTAILVFVVVLPLARFLAISVTRLLREPPAGLVELAFSLEKWTMWEVYALALIVVAVKLGEFAEIELRAGFWLILAMVPLSLLDGWLFRRRLELRRTAS